MLYILIDTFLSSITGINIQIFPFYLNYANIKDFSLSIILLYLLNENIMLIIVFIIMYLLSILLYKYLNHNIILELGLYTGYYFILNRIDAYFFINIFLVIILKLTKYYSNRWSHVRHEKNKQFS